jgi:hypothetical protein
MTVSRLALHMIDALPLRSVWIGQPAPRRPRPLWRRWMTLAMLALASTALAVVIAWVLRRAL